MWLIANAVYSLQLFFFFFFVFFLFFVFFFLSLADIQDKYPLTIYKEPYWNHNKKILRFLVKFSSYLKKKIILAILFKIR